MLVDAGTAPQARLVLQIAPQFEALRVGATEGLSTQEPVNKAALYL